MDLNRVIDSLHPLERKVLPHLSSCTKLSELALKSSLQEVEAQRALQWLENKEMLSQSKEVKEKVIFGKLGKQYAENGLPEKRFIYSLSKKDSSTKESLMESANLSEDEFSISLGLMKKKGAIDIKKEGNDLIISITNNGKEIAKKLSLEELFLKKLKTESPEISKLKDEEKFAYEELKKRKDIVDVKKETEFFYELNENGKKLSKVKINEDDIIDNLSSEDLKTGRWKEKRLRRYDVEINVPLISGGKRHFVKQAMRYAKEVWKDLGFVEMQGNLIQTSFWNFDALFTAQDHPVREMQDTYFIKNPKDGNLPDKEIVEKVKLEHQGKGKTMSYGWGERWLEENAKLNVMRTHTTPLSAQTLSVLKDEDIPSKFFAIGRCFRNEAIDWSHLNEFNQTEGTVVDKNANFRHLLGYLKQFFTKMGFPQARFRPAFFPYTSPSVEIDVYHPKHKKWIELGGAGIFRPEVVKPLLGEDIPVLAWGPGFDRIIMDYYEITDLRDLYKNDIKQLRGMKIWLK